MRIALVSTLATTVRPGGGGSVESLIWLLAREYVAAGHDVTVFAAGGSIVSGTLVSCLPGSYGAAGLPADWHLCEWMNLCCAVERSTCFDVIHTHAYLWGLTLENLSRAPMVHTMHIMPDDAVATLWSMRSSACVTAISAYQWHAHTRLSPAAVIHHSVDEDSFPFSRASTDYVCYLGRFTPGKGPLQAIESARRLGIRLLLAGPESPYFRDHIRKHVDGTNVEYVGQVSGSARARLLGSARALLYPITSPEPFGLVLVEANMCGTPVAALRRGAVSEIITEGVTGFSTEAEDAFDLAVVNAMTLDRSTVHKSARARFSSGKMAASYLAVYEKVQPK